MEFKCINAKDGCFHKNKNGEIKICHLSPCQLNLLKFGTHMQIISHYLDVENWENAFIYFDNLSSQSIFQCDLEKLYEIKKSKQNLNMEDYPLGCRIFKIEADLRKLLNLLLKFQKVEANQKEETMSTKGVKIYQRTKTQFKRRLKDNLEILKHVVKDDQYNTQKENSFQKKGLEYLEKSIQLAKQYGDHVNVPNVVEQGFDRTVASAGFKIEEHRKANIIRTEIAKEQMSKDKLIKELKKQLLEKGKLTPELKEKMKELGD